MSIVCLSPNGVDVYKLRAPPRMLLVATMDGVIELEANTDGSWTETRRSLTGEHVGSLMADPKTYTVFAGTHGTRLYRSLDSGITWERNDAELASKHIFTLGRAGEGENAVLYAGCEPPLLYESRDGGAHWRELTALREFPTRDKWNFPAPPHIAHVKHVTADPRDMNVLYVCIEQGALLKSEDGGKSFYELHFQDASYRLNKDTHRIVFRPSNPDEIYLDGGDGIARSTDAGKTWERVATTDMRVAYPDHLFISPDDEQVLFVFGGGTPPNVWRETGVARAAVVRSNDRGRTWHQVRGGLPESFDGNIEAATMVCWRGGFGFFLGTTDGEVYASMDKGESWERIAQGIPPVSKCVHHRNLQMGRAKAASA